MIKAGRELFPSNYAAPRGADNLQFTGIFLLKKKKAGRWSRGFIQRVGSTADHSSTQQGGLPKLHSVAAALLAAGNKFGVFLYVYCCSDLFFNN